MTKAGVEELQAALPSCNIRWDAGRTPAPRTPVSGRSTRPAIAVPADSGVQNVRSDADLEKLIQRANEIRSISVSMGMLTPEGAKRLKEFPSLQLLFFSSSFIDDSVLESIAKTKISRLFIVRAAITDAGLKHLETMTTLRSLTLRDTDVTTEGMESLEKALPALRVMAPSTLRTPPTPARQ